MLVEFLSADTSGQKVHVAAGLIQTVTDVLGKLGVSRVSYTAAPATATVLVKGTADELAARVNAALAAGVG